jgi:hypothetical protein
MTSSHSGDTLCQWFSHLANVLDRRSAPRLALLLPGGRTRTRPKDGHFLDSSRPTERTIPSLLHLGRGGREEIRLSTSADSEIEVTALQDAIA